MGFGIKVDVTVEAPKVELPKVDVASAVSGATSAAAGAVNAAVAAVSGAVSSAASSATAGADAVAASLSSVPGALGDVAVSFTCEAEDLVLEPHLQLDANASWEDTRFENGPIWIFVDLTPEEADQSTDVLHIFSTSGNYDRRCDICQDYLVGDGTDDDEASNALPSGSNQGVTIVKVRFDDAPMSERFSLEVVPKDAPPYFVFQDVPYGDLRGEGREILGFEL
jgi:hypothetical protein